MLKKTLKIFFKDNFDEVDIKILRDIIQLFFIVGLLVFVISISVLGERYFEQTFWENVLVEAHGILLDILFLTFIYYIIQAAFSKSVDTKNKIDNIQDQIDSLKNWKSEEASRKIENHIKKLIKLGANRIDATNCFIDSANFYNIDLSIVDFQDSILDNSDVRGTDIEKANLMNCSMLNSKVDLDKLPAIIEKGAIT